MLKAALLKDVTVIVHGVLILLADSIAAIGAGDAGSIIITGPHGGRSAGEFALRVTPLAVFVNDAGVGKDRAGILALKMLQAVGICADAVEMLAQSFDCERRQADECPPAGT